MHDPKFEKEVQQKLEELIFTPSEAVWAKVERAVTGEKKRRTPMFWLLFTPGMVAAAGFLYLVIGRTPPVALPKNAGIARTVPSNMPAPSGTAPDSSSAVPYSSASVPSTSPTSPVVPATPGMGKGIAGPDDLSSPAKADGTDLAVTNQPDRADKHRNKTGMTLHNSGGQDGANAGADTRYAQGGSAAEGIAVQPNGRHATPNATSNATPLASLSAAGPLDIASGFRRIDQARIGQVASNTTGANKSASAKKIQLNPKRSWEAGFTGGAGLASVNDPIFHRSAVNASYNTTNTGASVSGATQNPTSSRVKPGLSAWVGILLQKPVSNRVSVSAGMNLHYYSTRIQTGPKVTQDSANAAYLPYSYLATTSAYAAPLPTSYPYYQTGTGNEFTNRYYFLEVPVSVQWRINHSQTLPLFWEGGISVSYLMSSDALYYDTNTGVYYKDAGVTNRTQIGVSTALLAGMPFRGSRIQVGPQLQYSLARMLNTNAPGDGHLFYGGVKIVVLPGKSVNRL
jgi:outer membrane protein with beta-barrel domain